MNIQDKWICSTDDGGRTHVIVFTQYLCALNEADVGWRGQRETYQIHVESSC